MNDIFNATTCCLSIGEVLLLSSYFYKDRMGKTFISEVQGRVVSMSAKKATKTSLSCSLILSCLFVPGESIGNREVGLDTTINDRSSLV